MSMSTRVKKTFPKNHAQLLALSWVVYLEVLGPGSRVPGSWFLSAGVGSWDSGSLGSGSWVLILDYATELITVL